ncbi:MAG: hypothetical protein RIQ81_1880 [Pseudomonadota bacterium]|jgi:hypothetical protein
MKINTIRSLALTIVLPLMTLQAGCGSKDDGDGSSGDNKDPNGPTDLVGPGRDPVSCAKAWQQFVATNPAGMKLVYETKGMGFETTYSSEIIESNDSRVTIRATTSGEDHDSTTTREDFLETCQKGIPGSGDDDNDSRTDIKVEERRKESKTVRAGTFSSDYMRLRQSRLGGQDDSSMVSEIWTSTEAGRFLVFQRNMSTFGTETYETTTELVSIRRP